MSVAAANVKQGGWDRRRFTGYEISGKVLGLVGVGEIARRVARRAATFGMTILGYDPFVGPYDYPVSELGIKMCSFENLLVSSDFISIHLPLTPQTRLMFSQREFALMKPSSFLINTARGEIIDESAFLAAIRQKRLAGACLDVLATEPVPPDHPLLQCDNVLITPHIAGLTEESQERTSLLVATEVINVLQGKPALCMIRDVNQK